VYWPTLSDARLANSYQIGPYMGMLFTDCKSVGGIQYTHVLMVFKPNPLTGKLPPKPVPSLAVAAEVNSRAEIGGGSHFLGVFPGDGHMNLGGSDEWANLEKFAHRALEFAAEHLNVNEPARPLFKAKKPWWQFWKR
jgi:hypothetical protein